MTIDELVIPQHFYASTTVGLTGRRGYQSVACSEGIRDLKAVEVHCDYARPKGRDSDWPVNWGWFPLDDESICLHRMAYSGSDEHSRPGNFMAHNLILSRQNAEQIDYDLCSLLEWVRQESGTTYCTSDVSDRYPGQAMTDGFVRRHEQVLRKFGETPEVLRTIPPLRLPLEAIHQIRARKDSAFIPEVFEPLCETLGPEGLAHVVEFCLNEEAPPKPILIVGLSEGDRESEAERQLADFLWTVLPFHCRRVLPFSTYVADPMTLLRSIHLPGGKGNHQPRLLMAPLAAVPQSVYSALESLTLFVDVKQPIPAARGKALGTTFIEQLRKSQFKRLARIRDCANHFNFEKPKSDLQIAIQIEKLLRNGSPKPSDIPIVHRGVERLRHEWPALVPLECQLIDFVAECSPLDIEADPLRMLVQDHLTLIERHPQLLDESPENHQPNGSKDVRGRVVRLLAFCVQSDKFDAALRDLVQAVAHREALADYREDFIRRFLEEVESCVRREAQTGPSWEPIRRIWSSLQQACQEGGELEPRFRHALASRLCEILLEDVSSETELPPEFVSLLSAVPLENVDALEIRLTLLKRIVEDDENEEEAAEEPVSQNAGPFLVDLVERQFFPETLLATIRSDHQGCLLRFYGDWLEACEKSPVIQEAVHEPLDRLELLTFLWKETRAKGGRPDDMLLEGTNAALDRFEEFPPAEPDAPGSPWVMDYLNEGLSGLTEQLDAILPEGKIHEIHPLVQTHCRLLNFLEDRGELNDPSKTDAYLFELFVPLCCASISEASPGESDLKTECLASVLECVLQRFPDVTGRTKFFGGVPRRIKAWLSKTGHALVEEVIGPRIAPAFEHFTQLEADDPARLIPDEASWYQTLIKGGLSDGRELKELLSDRIADLLIECPQMGKKRESPEPFYQFIRQRVDEQVSHRLSERLFEASQQPGGLAKWFREAGPYAPLTRLLVKRAASHPSENGAANLLDATARQILREQGTLNVLTQFVEIEAEVESKGNAGFDKSLVPREIADQARIALIEGIPKATAKCLKIRKQEGGVLPSRELALRTLELCRSWSLLRQYFDDKSLPKPFLPQVGACLFALGTNDLNRMLPDVVNFIKRWYGIWQADDIADKWWQLLSEVDQSADRDLFHDQLVRIGESLLAGADGSSEQQTGALRGLGAYTRKYRAPSEYDYLKDALNTLPASAQGRLDNPAVQEEIRQRILLAGYCYFESASSGEKRRRVQQDAVLVGILWQMGCWEFLPGNRQKWRTDVSALAIAEFLAHEELTFGTSTERAARLFAKSHWSEVRQNHSQEIPQFLSELESCLTQPNPRLSQESNKTVKKILNLSRKAMKRGLFRK